MMQAMVAAPQGFNISHMLQPALSVVVSVGLGALGGTALGILLNAKPTVLPRTVAAVNRVIPQAVIARYSAGLYATRRGSFSVSSKAFACHCDTRNDQ